MYTPRRLPFQFALVNTRGGEFDGDYLYPTFTHTIN